MKAKRFFSIAIFLMITILFSSFQNQQDHKVLFEKAKYTMETKADLKEAINLFESLIKTYPNEKEYVAKSLLYQGMCYEKLGNQEAVKKYQRLVDNFPGQKNEVALAEERLNYLDEQLASLKKQAEQRLKKGNELFSLWEYEAAVEEYKKAMELDPNSLLALNAQYCMGQSLFRLGKYDLALETFNKLINENPKSNIAPVTELMISQVEYVMVNEKRPVNTSSVINENTIVSEQGITFNKIKTLTGESDIINLPGSVKISQNGKFLLCENDVVPMDGSLPFKLVDYKTTGIQASRGIWSPKGDKAAFYSGDALCVVPVSPESGHSTGPVNKIKKVELRWASSPGWSPDGKKLAYNCPEGNIWTIDADGNNLKQITNTEIVREFSPTWSPDGKHLAFGIGERSLGLYNFEGGKTKQLGDIGQRCFPLWSPDAKWLVMDINKLLFYDIQSNRKFDLKPPLEIGEFFSWSPNRKKMLFFKSSYHYNSGLKMASSEGGPSFELVPQLTNWGVAEWSKDSKLMAVQSEDENGDIVFRIVPLAGGKSYKVDLENLIDDKPFPFDINSDLDMIFFDVRHEDNKEDLYVVPISAKNAKTTGPAIKIFEGWYREGAYNIKFSASKTGDKVALVHNGDIWIAFTNGDKPIQVKNIKEKIGYIRWTPDGNSLLFNTPAGWRLIKNPENQSSVLKLLIDGQELECRWPNIRFSPDNSLFAIMSNTQIDIFLFENMKLKQTIDTKKLKLGPSDWWDIKWSPDGKNLAFVGAIETDDPDSYPDGKNGIYRISLSDEKIIRVAPDDDDWKAGISWSPDGKWIAYTPMKSVKVRPESTIWEADFDEVKEKLLKME